VFFHNTHSKHDAIIVTSKWRTLNTVSKEMQWTEVVIKWFLRPPKHTRIAIQHSSSFVSSPDCGGTVFPEGGSRNFCAPHSTCTVITPGASWWPHDPVTCNKTPWGTWRSIATWLRVAELEYTQNMYTLVITNLLKGELFGMVMLIDIAEFIILTRK
jgi:hypothetical protein